VPVVDTLSVEDKLKFAIINGEKSIGEAQHRQFVAALFGQKSSTMGLRNWMLVPMAPS
jgi:hypothetical protein